MVFGVIFLVAYILLVKLHFNNTFGGIDENDLTFEEEYDLAGEKAGFVFFYAIAFPIILLFAVVISLLLNSFSPVKIKQNKKESWIFELSCNLLIYVVIISAVFIVFKTLTSEQWFCSKDKNIDKCVCKEGSTYYDACQVPKEIRGIAEETEFCETWEKEKEEKHKGCFQHRKKTQEELKQSVKEWKN